MLTATAGLVSDFKRDFTAPSGRVYHWDKPEPPKDSDFESMKSWEDSLVEREKREGVKLDKKGNVVTQGAPSTYSASKQAPATGAGAGAVLGTGDKPQQEFTPKHHYGYATGAGAMPEGFNPQLKTAAHALEPLAEQGRKDVGFLFELFNQGIQKAGLPALGTPQQSQEIGGHVAAVVNPAEWVQGALENPTLFLGTMGLGHLAVSAKTKIVQLLGAGKEAEAIAAMKAAGAKEEAINALISSMHETKPTGIASTSAKTRLGPKANLQDVKSAARTNQPPPETHTPVSNYIQQHGAVDDANAYVNQRWRQRTQEAIDEASVLLKTKGIKAGELSRILRTRTALRESLKTQTPHPKIADELFSEYEANLPKNQVSPYQKPGATFRTPNQVKAKTSKPATLSPVEKLPPTAPYPEGVPIGKPFEIGKPKEPVASTGPGNVSKPTTSEVTTPVTKEPEVQVTGNQTKTVTKEPTAEPGKTTNVSLAESERAGMRSEDPEVRHWEDVAEEAKKLNLHTPEGAAKSAAKSKAGEALTDTEVIGMSGRLTAINEELAKTPRTSARYDELLSEAKNLRETRQTPEARALAARAALISSDMSPQGIVTAIEIKRGAKLSEADAARFKQMGEDLQTSKDRVAQLEEELKNAKPEKTAGQRVSNYKTNKQDAIKELMGIMGKASMNVDPAILKPIGKYVRATIQEAGGDIDKALRTAARELKMATGLDHTPEELWDAYKGSRPKRNITEDLIAERRNNARIASSIRRRIEDENASTGSKLAKGAASLSTEVKLWNPVARAIDQGSNLQEAIVTGLTGDIDRGFANAVLAITKQDARFQRVGLQQRAELAGRYALEVKSDWKDAMGASGTTKFQGGGPASHFAGMLDAPARAWHEIGFAGERASALVKKGKGAFGDIVDQIRDPELPGPLSATEARKLHGQMKDYGDVIMLTNANFTSRARGFAHSWINNSIPTPVQPIMHFLTDMGFQFSRVLVNVTDKSAQYANPFYGGARAIIELMPRTGGAQMSIELRAKTFAQILRRTGVGAAVSQLGYWWYNDQKQAGNKPEELLTAKGVPLGPELVRTYNEKGKKTGNVYQDEGYLGKLGGFSAAFFHGYRHAQIDASDVSDSQKEKMHKALIVAPIADNPVMSNVSRAIKTIDPSQDLPKQVWPWVMSIYWPGGLREWAHAQDLQEGVHSRAADGPVEEIQKRTPYAAQQLKAKGKRIRK